MYLAPHLSTNAVEEAFGLKLYWNYGVWVRLYGPRKIEVDAVAGPPTASAAVRATS